MEHKLSRFRDSNLTKQASICVHQIIKLYVLASDDPTGTEIRGRAVIAGEAILAELAEEVEIL